jgi:integrase
MADAGLRPGEACAIQWSDVDGLSRTQRAERAATNSGRIKDIKTGEAREMDLTPRLITALRTFRAELEADALVDGKDGIAPWVFATRSGTPPRPHRLAKTLTTVLTAAGLPNFRLYDLRHTYASHLIAQRADITYVARQLGHAKMTTTLLSVVGLLGSTATGSRRGTGSTSRDGEGPRRCSSSQPRATMRRCPLDRERLNVEP